jgi:hypothetical protein
MTEKKQQEKTIDCPIHGPFAASLKQFGCPDCELDDIENDEIEQWRHQRQQYKG